MSNVRVLIAAMALACACGQADPEPRRAPTATREVADVPADSQDPDEVVGRLLESDPARALDALALDIERFGWIVTLDRTSFGHAVGAVARSEPRHIGRFVKPVAVAFGAECARLLSEGTADAYGRAKSRAHELGFVIGVVQTEILALSKTSPSQANAAALSVAEALLEMGAEAEPGVKLTVTAPHVVKAWELRKQVAAQQLSSKAGSDALRDALLQSASIAFIRAAGRDKLDEWRAFRNGVTDGYGGARPL